MADLAIWMAGHVSIPIFPVLTADIVQYLIEHSGSKLLFVGKLDPVWGEMKKGVPSDLPTIAFPFAPENNHEQWDDFDAMLKSAKGIAINNSTIPEDRMLSYLPLAHVFERWISESVSFYIGFHIFFAESLDLLEGYAMTENFGYSHCTKSGEVRPGYVGPPYPDVQHRLSKDGETTGIENEAKCH